MTEIASGVGRLCAGVCVVVCAWACGTTKGADAPTATQPADRKAEYVAAVTGGVGFLPWQERGVSEAERAFRASIEQRKDEMLAARVAVTHPVLLTDADFERARRNMETADWARAWYEGHKEVADYVVAQPAAYVDDMLSELTPTNPYGFTCPNCVGKQSQEGVGMSLMVWNYRSPDVCSCRACGQVYPSEQYPETGRLVCPRSGQVFTYYLNEQERAHPEDRSGRYAWLWDGDPIHVSYTGIIRERKARFMIQAAKSLALVYRMTGEPRYARRAKEILLRWAHCYRGWLYHDYWDTIADCDPMYAAYHDRDLPLEWKRHLCGDAYKRDSADRAAMLQTYWGAGRLHPSTDAITYLVALTLAYDLTCEARDADGRGVWTGPQRATVERDLFLEYLMGAEPFLGGPNQTTNVSNKAPRVYHSMAAVAKCLGLTNYADTALRGYEAVRDESFLFDGFSRESPGYTNMFLTDLVWIPEVLHGFRWPADFAGRKGVVDVFGTDAKLRLMFRAMIDQLRPDGRYLPLSDTPGDFRPTTHLVELGLKRYPEYYAGQGRAINGRRRPTEYAVFHLDPAQIRADAGLRLEEICFPAWMTAILRHGNGPGAAVLAMPFSPPGPHRHWDNLAIFYAAGGHAVLGDQGYVGDMPANAWIRDTRSHNVVVVDDARQRFHERRPALVRMVTSPSVSVAEASSDAYPQCRDYRRLVALVKGPDAQTFAVDIFRVNGGQRHAYRVFSELASSDAREGRLDLTGLEMPAEPPLPDVRGSLARADIFGLQDVRGVDDPPPSWQAMWEQKGRRYRLWMLAPADRVEASNGPGQETRTQLGRRVRYVDVIRTGTDVESVFVAVHEPSGPDGDMVVTRAERLPVPAAAGPDAVAVRIESAWGSYLVFSGFERVAEVAGVRFGGAFGILHEATGGRRWMLTSEADTFLAGDFGFEGATSVWSGDVVAQTDRELTANAPRPADWQTPPDNVTPYVVVDTEAGRTGFAARALDDRRIAVQRFPLPRATRFRFASVRFLQQ